MKIAKHRHRGYARKVFGSSCLLFLGVALTALTACFNVTERVLPDACVETDDDHDTAGQGCGFGVDVSEFPFSWSGSWSDYDNTFFPGPDYSCGDNVGWVDVWFTVQIPAAGTLLMTENTNSNVIIRAFTNCTDFDLVDCAWEPEYLSLPSLDEGAELHVVVSEDEANLADELEMNFELLVD